MHEGRQHTLAWAATGAPMARARAPRACAAAVEAALLESARRNFSFAKISDAAKGHGEQRDRRLRERSRRTKGQTLNEAIISFGDAKWAVLRETVRADMRAAGCETWSAAAIARVHRRRRGAPVERRQEQGTM